MRHPTPIFDDPYAKKLCGPVLGLALRFRPFEWLLFKVVLAPLMPVSMCVVMRARYAEQGLGRAVEEGVRHYVILGAGMDSFAFRRPDLLDVIDAFEVDHPVTQKKKLDRISNAKLLVPANHHFIAADLSVVSTVEALAGTAFDMSQAHVSFLAGSRLLPDSRNSGGDCEIDLARIAPGHAAGSRLSLGRAIVRPGYAATAGETAQVRREKGGAHARLVLAGRDERADGGQWFQTDRELRDHGLRSELSRGVWRTYV